MFFNGLLWTMLVLPPLRRHSLALGHRSIILFIGPMVAQRSPHCHPPYPLLSNPFYIRVER